MFAKHDGAADDTVQFDAFNVVSGSDPQTPGDDCGGGAGCPQDDEFDGTALDPKWEIAQPDAGATWPSPAATSRSRLRQGDVSGANFTARNILLQAVPAAARGR